MEEFEHFFKGALKNILCSTEYSGIDISTTLPCTVYFGS